MSRPPSAALGGLKLPFDEKGQSQCLVRKMPGRVTAPRSAAPRRTRLGSSSALRRTPLRTLPRPPRRQPEPSALSQAAAGRSLGPLCRVRGFWRFGARLLAVPCGAERDQGAPSKAARGACARAQKRRERGASIGATAPAKLGIFCLGGSTGPRPGTRIVVGVTTPRAPAHEGDLEVREAQKTARPKRYAVVFHNDDYTTRDFVVSVLMEIFGKSVTEATQIMLHVHFKGWGIAGIYSRDVAETKVEKVTDCARSAGHPLKVTAEPEGFEGNSS